MGAALCVGLQLLAPGTAFAATSIEFELSGTFGEGVMVSYNGPDGSFPVDTVGLPWSTAFDYDGDAQSLVFSGSHPGGDAGSVTCRVKVNGRVAVSRTNNSPKIAGTGAVCHLLRSGSTYVGN
ncbi:hypothetical protein FZI91_01185 [Mycobacterium sp. CBMA271]|uniref:MmpS family transport accessory protein n=1 Tax=unclassified Mycobacteroides TaxID=2618759 RepID=UPI0012DD6B11|nr:MULTISPECIES: MmpS family transport accessory protein [unclassified Mycobacteroides]MUM19520.1 hypothetical protein [Mycobacteroides sp. CBMA 326]MUM20322.1 hypothetical protein [Mycobacteroides sp. CBMA 271]